MLETDGDVGFAASGVSDLVEQGRGIGLDGIEFATLDDDFRASPKPTSFREASGLGAHRLRNLHRLNPRREPSDEISDPSGHVEHRSFGLREPFGRDELKLEAIIPFGNEITQILYRVAFPIDLSRQLLLNGAGNRDDLPPARPSLLDETRGVHDLLVRQEQDISRGVGDLRGMHGNIRPFHLVVQLAAPKVSEVVDESLGDCFRRGSEQDGLHPVGIGGPPDIRPFAIESLLNSGRQRSDVVGEQEILLFGDANAVDVNVGDIASFPQDFSVLGLF